MKKEQVSKLEEIKIRLDLSKIYKKIRFLCSNISRLEWSGMLLYTVEGSITDPANMKIFAQDIIPMHIGSGSHTEYDIHTEGENKHIEYVMNNEESIQWRIGHIHSHHSMDVFFSGVDIGELHNNAENHNYYLSLIVNNMMEFTAKVAFVAKIVKEIKGDYMALDDNGNPYSISSEKLIVEDKKLITYDCDIITPQKELFDTTFMDNVKEIIEAKNKSNAVVTTKAPTKAYNPNSYQYKPSEDRELVNFLNDLFVKKSERPSGTGSYGFHYLFLKVQDNPNIVSEFIERYAECLQEHCQLDQSSNYIFVTEQLIDIFEEKAHMYRYLYEIIEFLKSFVEELEAIDNK